MRKIGFIVLLLLLLPALTGCEKWTQFYLDYESGIVVPSTFGTLVPFSVSTPEITTNSEAKFDSNGTSTEKVESIHLSELVMSINSPQGQTFSFLNSIQIYISSPDYAESRIAYRLDIPENVGSNLVCNVDDIELKKYLTSDSYTLRIETITDETIAQDVDISVFSKFWVDAKLLK